MSADVSVTYTVDNTHGEFADVHPFSPVDSRYHMTQVLVEPPL